MLGVVCRCVCGVLCFVICDVWFVSLVCVVCCVLCLCYVWYVVCGLWCKCVGVWGLVCGGCVLGVVLCDWCCVDCGVVVVYVCVVLCDV